MMKHGLQLAFEANRESLLRYLRAHGAGDSAEDLLQDLWLKVTSSPSGPVANPRNYLFRAATNLMIDHRRSAVQARRREQEWTSLADRLGSSVANDPGPERETLGRQILERVERDLEKLPARALAVFRAHRIDGHTQRQVAAKFGISASTVESDLRLAYRLLDDIRRRIDEE